MIRCTAWFQLFVRFVLMPGCGLMVSISCTVIEAFGQNDCLNTMITQHHFNVSPRIKTTPCPLTTGKGCAVAHIKIKVFVFNDNLSLMASSVCPHSAGNHSYLQWVMEYKVEAPAAVFLIIILWLTLNYLTARFPHFQHSYLVWQQPARLSFNLFYDWLVLAAGDELQRAVCGH